MTTRTKLSICRPREAWHALLSPHERANSLTLYKNPGLFFGWTVYIFLVTLLFRNPRVNIITNVSTFIRSSPTASGPQWPPADLDIISVVLRVVAAIIRTLVSLLLCILEVALVRLSLQRNNGPDASHQQIDTDTATQSDTETLGEEDVIL